MKFSLLLLTPDDAQADIILLALSQLPVIRCRTEQEALIICQEQRLCLVLIVEDAFCSDSRRVLAELGATQPGLTGILLSACADFAHLQGALEAGFSGLVELPVNAKSLMRVVNQALKRFRLQQENIRLRTLLPLYNLGEQFLRASTEQEIFDGLLDAVERQTGANHLSIMLPNKADGCLHIAAARGMDWELMQSIRLQPGDQIAGWVFQQGQSVILNKEDEAVSIFWPVLQRAEIVSAISFPLRIDKRILGVLNISQKENDERFSQVDIEMLNIICSQAAIALEHKRTLEQLTATTRMRTLFEQYVAPEVAELLLAQNSDFMELGEIKEVTVLFADIKNFTRLVQHIDLQAIRSFLNAFFHFFTEEVFQHRGTVDKFMGDAVLAIFGAPVKLEQPNLSAARAAWTIRKKFITLRDQWCGQYPDFQEVDLGIAITCGKVFLGNIGSARRLDYTVIGKEVNIAQRLAADSSSHRICLTDAVRREIAAWFEIKEMGERKLRGVEQKIQVFYMEDGK